MVKLFNNARYFVPGPTCFVFLLCVTCFLCLSLLPFITLTGTCYTELNTIMLAMYCWTVGPRTVGISTPNADRICLVSCTVFEFRQWKQQPPLPIERRVDSWACCFVGFFHVMELSTGLYDLRHQLDELQCSYLDVCITLKQYLNKLWRIWGICIPSSCCLISCSPPGSLSPGVAMVTILGIRFKK